MPADSKTRHRPASRKRPHEETKPRGTREALVWTGVELFTERGFHPTGIDEVLRRVKAPKGSFYHFFSGKHAFGEAVIEQYADYFARRLDAIFANASRSPLGRLRDFVESAKAGMARHAFRRGCLIGNMGQELGGLDDIYKARLEAVLRDWQARTAQCLREAAAVGEIAADADVEAMAEFFWIGWEGAILRAKLTRSTAPMDRFAELFFSRIAHP